MPGCTACVCIPLSWCCYQRLAANLDIIMGPDPWIDFLSWVCIVTTLLGYSAGIPACLDIINQKTTNGTPFLPFLLGYVANIGCLWYGILIWDWPSLVCNSVGTCLYTFYVIIYINYTNSKVLILQVVFLSAIALTSFYLYLNIIVVVMEDVVYQLGMTLSSFILIWNISPILEINEVIHTKSSECISPHLSLAMFASSLVWALYGHAVGDMFIAGPCIPGVLSGFTQLFLWYRYPAKPANNNNYNKAYKID